MNTHRPTARAGKADKGRWHNNMPQVKMKEITESQNHRIVGVGRDLCGSSSPTPLPKKGHLQ